jgi:MinD-like ATPase involved in chromosome partitioning or flagellar assembly
MYVVTFYSFKGGVGRSMAMVNVGYQLAQAGRTVLMVDFDLEAPGLTTFNLQRPTRLPGGVVDYVHDYLKTGEAPSVADYVYPSESFPNEGRIYVMPAGKSDGDYSPRFQSIDWQELYARHDGYLLFEELKEQWRATFSPDYVLIDSRTGHTDIAGICTRQLPNAVCVLFFPNEQNLVGLRRVVNDIRAERREGSQDRNGQIALHFVVSNVPTLDDEEKIVASRLKTFSDQLKYKNLSAQIHHYDSLALVNQLVFSRDRPNSYLSQEYRTLTEAIRRNNLEDRDTALETLRRLVRGPRGAARQSSTSLESPDTKLRDIGAIFHDDGEVSFWLGMAWRASGDASAALLLFDRALDHGYATREVYFERGAVHRGQQNTQAAAEDFWRILNMRDPLVSGREVVLAVKSLVDLGETDVEKIAGSWSVMHLATADSFQLAERLNDSRLGLELTKSIFAHIVDEIPLNADDADSANHYLGVSLIGLGECEEAKRRLNPQELPVSQLPQHVAFNLGMAAWGAAGRVDTAFFARVLELNDGKTRPRLANYFQCLAIAHWASGAHEDAESALSEARQITKAQLTREFSAWRYMKIGPDEFLKDLAETERLFSGEHILPRYMTLKESGGRHRAAH